MTGYVWCGHWLAGYPRLMDSVNGVITTGLYCRRDCLGRPRPEVVVRFRLPAAAEAAGFRACPQCRPDRLDEAVSWDEPEPVCRAVRMILDGVLDEDLEAELAGRLSVSVRHLRRLFMARLGVTPNGLARSRRVHFARSLLDETDLPVTEVAFAAGYGSARQFNRDFQATFGATPSKLRAGRSSPGRLAADGGLTLRLWFTGPLDWDGLVAFLAMRAIPGVEQVDGRVYRRTIVVDGDPGVLELSQGGAGYLSLRVHLPHWAGLMHLVSRARRIASLEEDVSEPARSLSADPVIGPLLADRPGIRVPGAWDPFEVGTVAIIGQRLPVSAVREFAGELAERFGDPVPGLGRLSLSRMFPAPPVLAAAQADLAAMGLPDDQAHAVSSFASAVSSKALRLDRSTNLDQMIKALTAIPFITQDTAHYIALRTGDPDAYPASDPALAHAIARLAPPSSTPARPPSQSWRPWRSYAAAHLWAAQTDHHTPTRTPGTIAAGVRPHAHEATEPALGPIPAGDDLVPAQGQRLHSHQRPAD